jgi:hypothetical protein
MSKRCELPIALRAIIPKIMGEHNIWPGYSRL